MTKLTGLERIVKAVKRQEPDTVPTFELIIDRKVRDAIKPGLSLEDFCEHMDLDAVCYHELLGDRFEAVDESKRMMRDQWGAIQQFSAAGTVPIPREPAIKSEKDLDNYISPDPDLPSRYQHIEEAIRRFKSKRAVIVGVRPFATIKDSLRGDVNLFKDMVRNPNLVDQLCSIVSEYYSKFIKNLIDIGVDIIIETADWAITQGPMVSPELTKRFIIPTLQQVVEECHSRGVPCLKHTDGNIWPIFDMIVETGVDGVHPIDPLAGMDLREAKTKYGDRVCLMGNVDCGDLLSFGNKEEVRQEVKECIRQAGEGGGYICMSSNSIHNAVNPENYFEMVKSIREYGKYPLSL